jgi:predicted P-loop ATPase
MVKWFVGVVKCALEDNYVNKYVFTLIGGQNTRKTSFFRMIVPKILKTYYDQPKFNSDRKDNDQEFKLACNLLLNMDEIDTATKNDVQHIKSLTSLRDVKQRRPYAKNEINCIRVGSFCATGNHSNLLNDPTGNARFIVFYVGENIIDTEDMGGENVDKQNEFFEKVWGEVMYIYKNHENAHNLTNEDDRANALNNINFETISAEAETLYKYDYINFVPSDFIANEKLLQMAEMREIYLKTTTEIYNDLQKDCEYKLSIHRLGSELKKNGFIQKLTRCKDKIYRYWILQYRSKD